MANSAADRPASQRGHGEAQDTLANHRKLYRLLLLPVGFSICAILLSHVFTGTNSMFFDENKVTFTISTKQQEHVQMNQAVSANSHHANSSTTNSPTDGAKRVK